MPDLLTEEQKEQYIPPEKDWSDSYALGLVQADFASAENYLQQNHHQRWMNAERTYLAYTEQKYWEGTKVPRATPSVFLALEQIEALLPVYMSTVFGDDPWAEAVPEPGTTAEQARISRDFVLSQFDNANGRDACRRAFKSGLIFGNGIIESGWESFTRKGRRYLPQWKNVNKTINLPLLGPQKVFTGELRRIVKETETEETINRPFYRYTSLRDFFIDPNTQSPNVQDARYAGKKCWLTVDELDALREDERFNIPGIEMLRDMARAKKITQGDSAKSSAAAWRGESWQPGIDKTEDLAGKRIEVINYWTKARSVWLLNREWVAYNQTNDYRDTLGNPTIPFFNNFYIDVLDRFYAMALTDLTEWDQRLIVGILGARLDELALNLNPPRIKQRGFSIPPYQLRRRPGAIAEVDVPKDQLIQEPVSNVTGQAFAEVQAAEIRSQKTTGVTDLSVLGTASAGGNAAARTATGVNTQAAASGRRSIYLVENSESQFIEPLLNFTAGMNHDYLDPNQMLEFRGPRGEIQEADPLEVMNATVKFKMRAGSRARAQQKLQQLLPLVLQTIMNPQFLQLQAQLGNTLDIEELTNIIADAADYRPRGGWFRPMNEQEQQQFQAAQQPQPDPTSITMQRERLAGQGEQQEMKITGDLVREIVKGLMAQQKGTGTVQ